MNRNINQLQTRKQLQNSIQPSIWKHFQVNLALPGLQDTLVHIDWEKKDQHPLIIHTFKLIWNLSWLINIYVDKPSLCIPCADFNVFSPANMKGL